MPNAVNSPQPTPEAPLVSSSAFDNIVSQDNDIVNSSIRNDVENNAKNSERDNGYTYNTLVSNNPCTLFSSRDREVKETGEEYGDYDKPITIEDIKFLREIIKAHGGLRVSINDFTSEDIKKAQKWAYKFYKELETKSPFFRAWFGDWRAHEQTKAPLLDKIKIASVSSASDGSNWVSNGIKNRILYRGNVINNDTRCEINIGTQVYNDTLTYANRALSRDKDINNYVARLSLLGSIKEIVEKSLLLDTITVKDDEKNVDRTFVHKFYTAAKINNKYYLVKLSVDEFNPLSGTIRRAYNVNNIEISLIAVSQVYSPASTIGDIGDFLSDIIVAVLYQLVKQYDKEFSAAPKVSPLLLNEDGTPKVFYHGTQHRRRQRLLKKVCSFSAD